MLDRLADSVASQRRFIANASHELRTPLAIQRAAIQIGLDHPSPDRLAQVRQELLEVNRRNERLIDGLLILAQGDHGLESTESVALDVLALQVVDDVPAEGISAHRHVGDRPAHAQPGRAGVAAAADPHRTAGAAGRPRRRGPRPVAHLRQEQARKRREVAERDRALYRDDQDDDYPGTAQ